MYRTLCAALCNVCRERVPAEVHTEGESVYLKKACPAHGEHRSLIATDASYWSLVEETWRAAGRAKSCSLDRPLMVFLEVIDECDLACKTCIAGSLVGAGNARSRLELQSRLRRVVDAGVQIDLLLLTGGEPTLHPELPEIIADAHEHASQIVLITNGQRIAADVDYLRTLKHASSKLHICLQFDSLRPEALEHLRGANLVGVRKQAVANLDALAVPTTLISVVKQGVNDQDLTPTVDFALAYETILGVTFQPIRAAGRHSTFDYASHHITLTDVRSLLQERLHLPTSFLKPHPADPYRVAVGYLCRNSRDDLTERLWSATGLLPPPLYVTPGEQQTALPGTRPLRIAVISYYDQFDLVLDADRPSGIVFLDDLGQFVSLEEHFLRPLFEPQSKPIHIRRTP
jgi:7,8-dihydro-6-hydroxymethylpterin dimethyltransferase